MLTNYPYLTQLFKSSVVEQVGYAKSAINPYQSSPVEDLNKVIIARPKLKKLA